MRSFWLASGCVLLPLVFHGTASAQTMVEYGAAAGAAATAASASKGASNGIAGAFESLGKALNQAQDQAPVTIVHTQTLTPAKPKKEAAKSDAPAAARPAYEDATGIQKGMSCDEVARRFGPPAMAFAGEESLTMSYAAKGGGVQVDCQNGKVASVVKPL